MSSLEMKQLRDDLDVLHKFAVEMKKRLARAGVTPADPPTRDEQRAVVRADNVIAVSGWRR
jgi:hypothetical protein